MKQSVFSFFTVASYGGRRTVEHLCRFNAERFSVLGKFIANSGKLCGIEYEAWLRFYTPLCERGVGE